MTLIEFLNDHFFGISATLVIISYIIWSPR